MKPVVVVGAGFSGLTLAHELRRLEVPVRIVERSARPGGLISTEATEYGLVETAANALLCDPQVEELFGELKLEFAAHKKPRKRRYVFWKKPRRWPLSPLTSLKLLKIPICNFLTIDSVRPRPSESVATWSERVINREFNERLLSPALQGVYAGDVKRMSATIALGGFFARQRKGERRGSVAPKLGMGQLIQALTDDLIARGVEIEYGMDFSLPAKVEGPTVICTSAWAAKTIVQDHDPALAHFLGECESLPLVTVTAFFNRHFDDVQGFGCLFPEAQQFQALGVLFNDCIFGGRSKIRSETWILGGANARHICDFSDDELKAKILEDRARISALEQTAKSWHITRWPRAIPHYTTEWEENLRRLKVNRPLFLHGNYLGQLGLARIQHRSAALAVQLKDLYVS